MARGIGTASLGPGGGMGTPLLILHLLIGVIVSFDQIDTSGQRTPRCTPVESSSTRPDSQGVVSVDFYKGDRVNLLKKYDYPILAARRGGLELSYGIDGVLAGFARGAKKRVVAPETSDAALRATRAATGGAAAAALEKALDELESGRTAANFTRLAAAWAEADLAHIQPREKAADDSASGTARSASAQVLDDRNRGMAAGIDALHSSGSNVFAAVGSLHMVGTVGLPRLMSEMGYKLRRSR